MGGALRLRFGRTVALLIALGAGLTAGPASASTYSIIPGGASVTATTTTADENATLTFSGQAGQRVSLALTNVTIGTSNCCSTLVSIRKPDGTVLGSAVNVGTLGGFVDTKTLPVTGTYTILVDPQGTATGSITLRLYDVPADATAAITPGGPAVTVSTTVPGQNAQASFTGTAGQRVSLKVGPNCCTTKISILKPDGTIL